MSEFVDRRSGEPARQGAVVDTDAGATGQTGALDPAIGVGLVVDRLAEFAPLPLRLFRAASVDTPSRTKPVVRRSISVRRALAVTSVTPQVAASTLRRLRVALP